MKKELIASLEKEMAYKVKQLREPYPSNAKRKVPVHLLQELASIKKAVKELKQQEMKVKKRKRILE